MWVFTKKTFDNKPMFFQFQVKNNVCIFNFTNLKQIFSKDLHKSSLASTYSKTDKNIEVEIEDVIEFLENIGDKNNISFNFCLDQLNLRTDIIITLQEGFPLFILELKLELKDANYFYLNMTSSLLNLIQLLKKNQQDLCNLLKKKDLEIAEYKLEGGNITHEHMKTEIFDEHNFLTNMIWKHDNGLMNLCDVYSSSLIEQLDKKCPGECEELNTKSNMKNKKLQNIPLKNKCLDRHNVQSSTTMDITPTTIHIKKMKTSSILKNL